MRTNSISLIIFFYDHYYLYFKVSNQLFMKLYKIFKLLPLVAIFFLQACKKESPISPQPPPAPPTPPTPIVIQAPPAFGFYVVGYFPSYRNNLSEVPDIKFRMCNVINYAFFSVNSTGTLTINNPTLVPQVVAKAKANNAKIFVSINEAAANNFKNMAVNSTGRNSFIKDVMANVRLYNFDGVDIDWEYPSTEDGTDVTFTSLIKELSDSLHRDAKYYLTIAITSGKYAGKYRDAIKNEVFGYADMFNIMAYDDFSTTLQYKQHSDYPLAVTAIDYWVTTRGMPKEKAVLGFPAYGRASGITQTGTTLAYRNILEQGGSSQSDSAIITSNPAFPAGYKVYYNGQPTVRLKALLAKQRVNGVMMWEKWQDAPDANSLLKAACDAVGRTY
jgi:GH18 family chitinase